MIINDNFDSPIEKAQNFFLKKYLLIKELTDRWEWSGHCIFEVLLNVSVAQGFVGFLRQWLQAWHVENRLRGTMYAGKEEITKEKDWRGNQYGVRGQQASCC